MNTPEEFRTIFAEMKNIAVVGLSSSSMRPSNGVAAFMQEKDYRVIPVNPFETEVLGQPAYARLAEVPDRIDLVDIFRRSDFAGQAVDEAIEVGAKAVWMQEGVIDHEAAERAAEAGLIVVMNHCWLKEWYRYGS